MASREGVRLISEIVPGARERDDLATGLDELMTQGARRMLITGLEAEVADYIERHHQLDDGDGHRFGESFGVASLDEVDGGLVLLHPDDHGAVDGGVSWR